MAEKRTRKTLTLKQKIEIINMLDNGAAVNDLAKQFGVAHSTICTIRDQREKLMTIDNISDTRRVVREGSKPELEKALYKWFLEQRARGGSVFSEDLKSKAREISFQMTGEKFFANCSWLARFKKRFCLEYGRGQSTIKSQDEGVVSDFAQTFEDKIKELGLKPEQLYCADASSLPIRVTNHKQNTTNDRFTFMPCSNATGTHKLNLLIISKEAPEGLKDETLQIAYQREPRGWLNQQIFIEWFHEEFVPAVRSFMIANNLSAKALLVLDDAPGYPEEQYIKSNDSMIQAMFMPPEHSHLMLPMMDQNLMNIIKREYRKTLLMDVVCMGNEVERNLIGLCFGNVLFALSKSWDSISPHLITSSWKKILPSIEIPKENKDYDKSLDSFVSAFRASGIQSQVKDWLEGNISNFQTDEIIPQEFAVVVIKMEPDDFI